MSQEQFTGDQSEHGEILKLDDGVEIIGDGSSTSEPEMTDIPVEEQAAEADAFQIRSGVSDAELKNIEIVGDDIRNED
jgi:hypothetical protein